MWKPIPGHSGYEASRRGQIRNAETKHVLRPMWTGKKAIRQYATVVLHGKQVKVHRAVLMAHVGLPPRGRPYALHRDDNTRNNALSNLQWGSPTDNARSVGHRKDQKVTAAARIELRSAHARGEKLPSLAARYGISYVRAWELCNTHWEIR